MAATVLSRTYGTLLSATLDAFRPRLADNITKSIRLLWALEGMPDGRGMRTQNGGEKLRVPVVYRLNNTVGSYSGFEGIDVTPQDPITSVFEDWAQSAGSIAADGLSLRKNSGNHALLNYLGEITRNGMDALREETNRQLVAGTLSGNQFIAGNGGKDMIPLSMLVGYNGTAGGSALTPAPGASVHGVNPENETWWKNQFREAASGGGYRDLWLKMQQLYMDTSEGGKNDPTNFILADPGSYLAYERSMFEFNRFPQPTAREANIAFDSTQFRNARMLWDGMVPDVYTPAIEATTVGTMFFLNLNWLTFVKHPDAFFTTGEFRQPHNQDAMYALILLMGQLTVENRRKQGVLYRINTAMNSLT